MNCRCVLTPMPVSVSDAYLKVSVFYGDKKCRRTGERYITHIAEGLQWLEINGGSERAKIIFCLHPLYQDRTDLMMNLTEMRLMPGNILEGLLEYRFWANAWNSKEQRTDSLVPIHAIDSDVLYALRADKVQNYAHYLRNKRIFSWDSQDRLDAYYQLWFDSLDQCETL